MAALALLLAFLVGPAISTARAADSTVFGDTAPGGNALEDSPVEVGMKIVPDENGFITGLRFYKQPNNTGTHVGHLWAANGTQLAEVQFANETASGWQQQALPSPVAVTAGTTYITSYYAANGKFGFSPGYFASGAGSAPLRAPSSAASGGNGVYKYSSSSTFPSETFNSTNYWVDAVFSNTPPADTRAPQIASVSPADGATGVSTTSPVKVTFDEAMNASTITTTNLKLKVTGGADVAATVSFDAATKVATLTPTAPLSFGTSYTATVKGGATGVADTAGNRLAADQSWSFTGPKACPCTVFDAGSAPLGGVLDSPVEVGMKFRSAENGYITRLRFYKLAGSPATHTGALWSSTGQKLGEVTFANETASGWQEQALGSPIAITKDTTYVVSYFASDGRFGFSPGGFGTGITNLPMRGLADGADGGNGVFKYGGGFPTDSFAGTNYWIDATFERTLPADTRPPAIQSATPASGAVGVAANATVNVTFDEPLDPQTVNNGALILRDPTNQPVVGLVAYDGATRTVKLTPSSALQFGKTYTVTVKSGSAGVTDVAGNRIASDIVWTFSTPQQCPCTVFSGSGPGGNANHDTPLEVGMKFRSDEDGYITSLRFWKQTNNTGNHVGHLWAADGRLLATARYTGESGSGWQVAALPNPIPIVKNTTYITSYYSPNGNFAFDPGGFATAKNNPPMRGLANGVDGTNGVFHIGASAFPSDSFNSTNYWVDASFERTVGADTQGPTVIQSKPDVDDSDVARDADVTITFDEALNPATVTTSAVQLRDRNDAVVTTTVSYDNQTHKVTMHPTAPLAFGGTYKVVVKGGASGVADTAGNRFAADKTWSFDAVGQSPEDGPGGPVLLVTNPADKFSSYYAEILRSEGLNEFTVAPGPVTNAMLQGKTTVLLANSTTTDAEAALLNTWVSGGGNLVALRPSKKLAGLLGLTDANTTLSNAWMKVDGGSAAGAGIYGQTMQYHGTADRYTLNGATALATLYSNKTTATTNPAVTLRDVGSSGGQAAAFTFDLARSIVYTRQGNPAWAGQKRDTTQYNIRSSDLFYGAKAGDVQPDWVDPDRFEVPQADEQQRLLANVITQMNLDKAPLPRFWYLPSGDKAAVVLTGDDHNIGGTVPYFDRLKKFDKPGCSVADWECPRATSYLFTGTPITDAQVAAYQADGFELALHANTNCTDFTPASLEQVFASQLASFGATWPSARRPVTNRTHCIPWSDWATQPKVERAHGIRFDTNYYYKGPDAWVREPGLMTGSGFPQRFADLDGSMIDVYQAMTQVTDEEEDVLPTTTQMHELLENALGDKDFWGAFTVILHSDYGDHQRLTDLVAMAQDDGVPVVSSEQMLEWLDGRNSSSFANLSYSGGQMSFSVVTNPKARDIEAMLPASSTTGPLSRLTRDGHTVSWTKRTVKGVQYVVFDGTAGAYVATYATDTTAPDVSNVTATADGEGHATVKWTTDEPSTSQVDYGRNANLGHQEIETAPVTDHSVELDDLEPGTTYSYRVSSADPSSHVTTVPAAPAAPSTFVTPAAGIVDSRTSDFAAGERSGTFAGATLDGTDGEVQLQPAIGEEFDGPGLPANWTTAPLRAGGTVFVSGGALVADASYAHSDAFYDAPATLEFSATFQPVNSQGVGLSDNLTDSPQEAFTTGLNGQPYTLYATSAGATTTQTPLPDIALSVPHRFRIEWTPTVTRFYVDGALVATHATSVVTDLRPVVSDYGLFGANVKAQWIRQGPYATSGDFTSRVLDSGPAANVWTTLTSDKDLPAGSAVTFQTRSGSTPEPDASWSAWQSVSGGGTIASPAARYIQYRAHLTGNGVSTPTVRRVQVSYTAGADRAPVPGTVTLAPSAPKTAQTVTATVAGFSDPDGDPMTYRYRWQRNGTTITGATGATFDLSQPGNGDSGDAIKVRVYATDGRGAASDAVTSTVTVANTAPTAGTVSLKPTAPSTNDMLTATPAGFADVDGDDLTYTYTWRRNGTVIAGQTGRKLDLRVAGNGDFGNQISVAAVANDGKGGASPAANANVNITATNATPIEGSVAITPAAPKTDATLTATPAGFTDPDGDTLTYHYQWKRNGTNIAGATGATLDLAVPGMGDRGDDLRVDVYATDNGGKASDGVNATATVGNTNPATGTVKLKPVAPATNDTISATPSGFSDIDGDTITYQYKWLRNGTAIDGQTSRNLDLSKAGNGDGGDTISVEVVALDGHDGTSTAATANQAISEGSSHPIAAFGFEEADGNTAVDQGSAPDGQLENGVERTNSGRFGRAVSFDGDDDVVRIPDDASLHLTSGMTIEAWVKPSAATYFRSVLLKQSDDRAAYSLYSNTIDDDVPSVHMGINWDVSTSGTQSIDTNAWTHLAGTYDGTILRLYINGTQVSAKAVGGDMPNGAGPLTIGANDVWGEQFKGLIDEVRVYNRALNREEVKTDMGVSVVPNTPEPPASTAPSAIGQFAAPESWPITAVHLALLSNGKVAAWDGFEAAVNSEHVWDPWTHQMDGIPNGGNLFCAGHITLSDGRLLVAGGHIQAYEGTRETNLLDPRTYAWSRGADMAAARWYPTATALPDGRVFVISGDHVTLRDFATSGRPAPMNDSSETLPEIYDPAANTWTPMPSATRDMALYPFMFVLPNGKLFDAGPDKTTRTLDLSTGQWTVVGDSPIDGHSAVMYRPGKVLKSGTWSEPGYPGRAVTNRAAAIDMTEASPQWREVSPMNYRRSFHTLTVLPDGNVLATGGATKSDGVDERAGVLATEMWNPDTDTWTTLASAARPRLYHSSALLLPDGRVLMAGGGAFGAAHNERNAEIYSPPYLFKGPRPTITDAPDKVHYGQSFKVQTPDANRIVKASLVRMGAVTHSLDMDQRYMNLSVTQGTGEVTLSGPDNANVAPPGFYMVFLLDDKGVPSVSHVVQVDAAGDTAPPSAPVSLTATAQPAAANLSWPAATDNVGVSEYRVYRSTTAGFTPAPANQVARVKTGTTYKDEGLASGTYYYRVRGIDKAGNLGAPSPQATVAIAGDTTAPTVSLTAPAGGASLAGTLNLTANAADAVGVQSVQFKLDGANLGDADTTAPYAYSFDTTKASDGPHTLTALARDASGNSTTSAQVNVEVHNTGIVAAYGFDEASGTTAVDRLGHHNGTIVGGAQRAPGIAGQALSFDGVDDMVTIPHDAALSLASGMTIEAWVRPSALGSWRSVVQKEQQPGAFDYALFANTDTGHPAAKVLTTAVRESSAAAPLGLGTWTNLAMTWDAGNLNLYVDGALVSTQSAPGPLVSGNGQLSVGGSSIAGQFFSGLIDEVRVYATVRTADQISRDMNAAINP